MSGKTIVDYVEHLDRRQATEAEITEQRARATANIERVVAEYRARGFKGSLMLIASEPNPDPNPPEDMKSKLIFGAVGDGGDLVASYMQVGEIMSKTFFEDEPPQVMAQGSNELN